MYSTFFNIIKGQTTARVFINDINKTLKQLNVSGDNLIKWYANKHHQYSVSSCLIIADPTLNAYLDTKQRILLDNTLDSRPPVIPHLFYPGCHALVLPDKHIASSVTCPSSTMHKQ